MNLFIWFIYSIVISTFPMEDARKMPTEPIILAWTKYNGRRLMRDYLEPNANNLTSCDEKCFYSDCKNL